MKQNFFALILIVGCNMVSAFGQEPAWDASKIKPCDRTCLTTVVDRYVESFIRKDRSSVPVAPEHRFTENTAQLDVGEGFLWKAKVDPTAFKIYVADPIAGQVALQTVLNIEDRPALVAIRLKVERGRILEIEHLIDRNVAPQAMELLRTPRPGLLNDIPASERSSREAMIAAANSYFDALEGDSGKIGAFADDCVRHENGYQTVNNKMPGRAAPGPNIPSTDSVRGRVFAKMSMMTCAEQVDTKAFSFIKKVRPRRVLIVDEQKGLVATFPLFIEDGTRRVDTYAGFPEMKQTGLAAMLNMTTMETFGVRGGKIHEVEVFPFVTLPYGSNNGWTPGAGRE